MKNFRMGNDYAMAYGQGLQLANVKKVNVANNRLSEKGSYGVL